MLFERSDREFIEAAESPAKHDALLRRLRKDRKGFVLVGIFFCLIVFGLGGWALLLLHHAVQIIMHWNIRIPDAAQPNADPDIDKARLIVGAICFLMFMLPWGVALFISLDARIKLLLYIDARSNRAPL